MAIVALLRFEGRQIYLPLVSSLPLTRNKDILFDSTARLLITDTEHLATAHDLIADQCGLINIDEIAPDLRQTISNSPILRMISRIFVYTSGSTGGLASHA